MAPPKVRAHYDQLQQVAARFSQNQQTLLRMLQVVKQNKNTLQGGDWVGQGATAFYKEMDDSVLPTLDRLVRALDSAASQTAQISKLMKDAEEQAAKVLKGSGGAGAPATGLAAAGPVGAIGGSAAGAAVGMKAADGMASANIAGAAMNAAPAGARSFVPGPSSAKSGSYIQGASASIPSSSSLPDGSAVTLYRGIPQDGGGYNMGAGASRAVSVWGDNFRQQVPNINDQRAKLDDSKAVLADTIAEEGAKVQAASKNMASGLRQLNKVTNGAAYALVKEYQDLGDMARLADMKASAAGKEADAALSKYAAAQSAVKIHEATVQQKSLEAERSEIRARIAERQEAIGTVIEIASAASGVKSAEGLADFGKDMAGKGLKAILGGMTDAEMHQLIAINSKIAALDDAIAKETDSQVRMQLQAAKSEMEGSFDKFVAAKAEARLFEKQQWGKLDQLAALETAHPSTGRVFRSLQNYDNQVRWVGDQLRDQTDGYLKTLNGHPIGDAGTLSQQVAYDIKQNSIYGPPDETWTGAAHSTEHYLDQVEAWRQGEIATSNQLRNELAQGREVDLVDNTMAAVDKALGGTATDEHLVR